MNRMALIVLAFSALLLFGCAQNTQQPVVQEPAAAPPQENATPSSGQCNLGNVVQKDDCFLAAAQQKGDPQVCRSIYSVGKLDECYAIFANSSLDICKQITDAVLRANCLTANAEANKSEDICNLIDNPDARAGCLKNVLPACKLILNQDARDLCMALEKGDYTLCHSDSCRQNYAQNKSDAKACGLITTEVNRYYCMAAVTGNAAECGLASEQALQDLCYQRAAAALNDATVCDLATKGSTYAGACYLYFAVNGSDMDYCSRPLTTSLRDQCYSDYATQAADTSSCPRIVNSLNQLACYYYSAGANRMPSLCNGLPDQRERDDCYSRAVLQPATGPVVSDCAKVTSETWKNKCYFKAAQLSYNASLCVPISPGPDKDSCNQLFWPSG